MNVLLVTVDSLRADRVDDGTMPFARSFADDAVEFRDCVANGPSTPASFPAIHASRQFASIEGLGIPPAAADGDGSGDAGIVTLAERLREAGYATAGFTDNHFASGDYHFDRGFESMHDASGGAEAGRLKQFVQSNLDKDGLAFRTIERVYTRVDALASSATGADSEYERAASLNRRALAWIDDAPEPWFVWLHYMDVHHPYEAPPAYQRQYVDEPLSTARCRALARKGTHHPEEVTDDEWELIRKLYDAECAYADDQFETLVGALDDRGSLAGTTVLFTADHGELVGEHGHAGHPPEFWEGVVRVPFLVAGPGATTGADAPGAGPVDGQVRLLDVPPTVTDAADVDPAPGWDGASALAVARGDAAAREFAFGDVGRQIDYRRSYVRRADGWKLMRHADDGEFLYDVRATPAEAPDENRVGEGMGVEADLAAALDDHRDRMAAMRAGDRGVDEDSEMVEQHLRSLGYLE